MTVTPQPSVLAWVTLLDPVDRQAFYTDLSSAVDLAMQSGDAAEIERCLRDWRLTAEGMANAELRDRLLES